MQPFPEEMLYDCTDDPHEINNLASSADPEHQEALKRLRATLETWMIETGDRGTSLNRGSCGTLPQRDA